MNSRSNVVVPVDSQSSLRTGILLIHANHSLQCRRCPACSACGKHHDGGRTNCSSQAVPVFMQKVRLTLTGMLLATSSAANVITLNEWVQGVNPCTRKQLL